MFHLWNLDSRLISMDDRRANKTTTANSGLAKGGVSCLVDTFVKSENLCVV